MSTRARLGAAYPSVASPCGMHGGYTSELQRRRTLVTLFADQSGLLMIPSTLASKPSGRVPFLDELPREVWQMTDTAHW